jgi:hypothetical protein
MGSNKNWLRVISLKHKIDILCCTYNYELASRVAGYRACMKVAEVNDGCSGCYVNAQMSV